MRALVTGGAGFIGSHLAEALVGEGWEVRVLDSLDTGKLENLEPVRGRIEFLHGSVTDPEMAARAAQGAQVVFHQAALPSVARSVEDPLSSNRVNVEGTLRMLLAARDAGVRRFVYASSSSAYGSSAELPKVETQSPAPCSPYAAAKLAGEHYCRVFHQVYGLEAVSLRYFNVFGPRQDPHSQYSAVIPRFIHQLTTGAPVTVFGDGEQSRDFTSVEDVVRANLLAAAPTLPGEAAGEAFNIACGARYSLNQLIGLLAELTGAEPEIQHLAERPGDVRHSLADIQKARRLLGYEPTVDFRSGLQRTLDFFRSPAAR